MTFTYEQKEVHMYLPWSVVPSRVPAAGDGSHVVLGFLHLIPCEALRLLCVVGGGHGGVGVPRARRIVVEGATLCGLGHAPHCGHHREAWGTLIPRHPTSIGVTTTQTMKTNSVLISNNPWVIVISNCDLWTVTYKWKCEITENIESFQVLWVCFMGLKKFLASCGNWLSLNTSRNFIHTTWQLESPGGILILDLLSVLNAIIIYLSLWYTMQEIQYQLHYKTHLSVWTAICSSAANWGCHSPPDPALIFLTPPEILDLFVKCEKKSKHNLNTNTVH